MSTESLLFLESKWMLGKKIALLWLEWCMYVYECVPSFTMNNPMLLEKTNAGWAGASCMRHLWGLGNQGLLAFMYASHSHKCLPALAELYNRTVAAADYN